MYFPHYMVKVIGRCLSVSTRKVNFLGPFFLYVHLAEFSKVEISVVRGWTEEDLSWYSDRYIIKYACSDPKPHIIQLLCYRYTWISLFLLPTQWPKQFHRKRWSLCARTPRVPPVPHRPLRGGGGGWTRSLHPISLLYVGEHTTEDRNLDYPPVGLLHYVLTYLITSWWKRIAAHAPAWLRGRDWEITTCHLCSMNKSSTMNKSLILKFSKSCHIGRCDHNFNLLISLIWKCSLLQRYHLFSSNSWVVKPRINIFCWLWFLLAT